MNARSIPSLPIALLLGALFVPSFSGCAPMVQQCFPSYIPSSTQIDPVPITAFRDRSYAEHRYERLVVMLERGNSRWRQTVESKLVKSFRARNAYAFSGSELFPPLRPWSQQEKNDLLADSDIDGYLALTLDTVVVKEHVVPEKRSTTTKKQRTRKPNDTAGYIETETITETREGGRVERSESMGYSIRLIDRVSGNVVWLGEESIGRDDYDGLGEFCERVAAQVERDGFLPMTTTLSH